MHVPRATRGCPPRRAGTHLRWRAHSRRRRHLPTGDPGRSTGRPRASRAASRSPRRSRGGCSCSRPRRSRSATSRASCCSSSCRSPSRCCWRRCSCRSRTALRDRGMHERAASLLVVVAGIALITVVLTLIVPPFVSELSELGTNVEKGSRQAGQRAAAARRVAGRGRQGDRRRCREPQGQRRQEAHGRRRDRCARGAEPARGDPPDARADVLLREGRAAHVGLDRRPLRPQRPRARRSSATGCGAC